MAANSSTVHEALGFRSLLHDSLLGGIRTQPAGSLSAAFVMSGQLRSFGEPRVHDSLARFQAIYQRADLFAAVSLLDSFHTARWQARSFHKTDARASFARWLGWRGRRRSLDDPAIKRAFAKLAPIALVTYNDSDVPCLSAGPCHRVASFNRSENLHWSDCKRYAGIKI